MIGENQKKITLNKYFLIVCFIGLIAFASYYFLTKTDAPSSLKIGYSPYTVNLPLFVASEAGLFASNGISVELIPFQSTEQMTVALRSGQITIASAPAAEGVYAINAKNPDSIRAFYFNIFSSTTDVDAIVIPWDSEIKNPSDLEGKTIGILPSNMLRIVLDKYLEINNVDGNKVKIITFPPASIIGAITSKGVDAAYILDPLITISKQKLKTKTMVANIGALTIADPLPAGFHCINANFAKQFPDIAKKLISIFDTSTKIIEKDKLVVVKALKKYTHLSTEIAEQIKLTTWAPYTKELEVSLQTQFDALQPSHNWKKEDYKKTKFVSLEN